MTARRTHISIFGKDYPIPPKGLYAGVPTTGLFETANALGEGRERGILREASSGEAATSTDGLGATAHD